MMKPTPAHPRARKGHQQGIALLAVLWLVAALSVMVIGLLHAVRGEVSIAGQSRKTMLSNGLADAAIRLVLQELVAGNNKSVKFIQTKTVSVFGNQVQVEVTPLSGYVDLNNAPANLLADTFEYAGGVSKDTAQRMATSAVAARDQKGPDGLPVRFHAVEDLLRLEGLDYSVYAKIKNFLTVDIVGSGRVNPLAASRGTLLILAKGDQARAQQLLESRHSNPESMDTTTLTATGIDMAPTSYLAVRATAATQDNTSFVRTWRVDIASPAYGLPWRVLGVEQSVVTATSLVK